MRKNVQAHFCLVTLVVFHVEHNQANIKPFTIFSYMKKLILILSFIALNVHAVNCLEFLRSAYLEFGMNNNYRPDSSYAPSFVDEGKIYYSSFKYHYTDNSLDSIVKCNSRGICDTYNYKQTKETTESTIKLTSTNLNYDQSDVSILFLGKDSTYKYIYGLDSGKPDSLEIVNSIFLRNDTLYDERWYSDGTPYNFGSHIRTPDPENENTCNTTNYTLEKNGDTYVKSITETYQELIETTETGFTLSYSNNNTKYFFVKVGPNSTTAILHKKHPAYIPEKAKHFDLLGRPANSKYIIKINR